MKKVKMFHILLFLCLSGVSAQVNNFSYYSRSDFSFASPGAMKYGLYGYDNPALLSSLDQMDLYLTWTDQNGNLLDRDNRRYGIFLAFPHFSFSVIDTKIRNSPLVNIYSGTYAGEFNASVTDYSLSASIGDKELSLGLSYGWSAGSGELLNHSDYLAGGILYRPSKYLSLGITHFNYSRLENESVFELAVRPFGNEIISLFGDYDYKNRYLSPDNKWSAGFCVEAFPGLRITGRYFEVEEMTLGLNLSLGNLGITTQGRFDKNRKYAYSTYGIRIGGYDRNLLPKVLPSRKYYSMELPGNVKYQKYKIFDNSNTLIDLINNINSAAKDPSIKGIAINLSGMKINRELLWEIREKLKQFKSSGKNVAIYFDNAGIDYYHFASVADKVIMDPQGLLFLEGYIIGRGYLKGTLEKLGIGYDEWRFFKYKSAAETYSRDKMSDTDREQIMNLVNNNYTLAKNEIIKERALSGEKFDELVNEKTVFMAEEALEEKLIDEIARWDKIGEIIEKMEGSKNKLVGSAAIEGNRLPSDDYWGEKPKIAIIYAIGGTSMDDGMNARSLSKYIESVKNDYRIKAVVLRVDSPGGDPLAADIVSEALRECRKIKPVIVSQGAVAASGGYWVSMYGDTIVAAPNTITGSIGVIGGWFYNKEINQRLGISTDYVKKGDHADLGFGFTFPFINFRLPDRNLTPPEKTGMEKILRGIYEQFISKVAEGRNMNKENVDSIGQGRVWSGLDGVNNGLIDVLGGLDKAIELARQKGKIEDENYELVEYPEPGLINFDRFMPKLISTNLEESNFIKNLKLRMEFNGRPLLMLPLEMDIEDSL